MKELKTITIIVSFIAMIFGVVTICKESGKVMIAGVNLLKYSSDIEDYNNSSRKTNEWTKKTNEKYEERSNRYYESEDKLVRLYSNSNDIIQLFGFFLAMILFFYAPFILLTKIAPIVLIKLLIRTHKALRKKISRKKRKKKKLNSNQNYVDCRY